MQTDDLGVRISSCRSCGSTSLTPLMNLGPQALTGTFPLPAESVPFGELELVVCGHCTLVQLSKNFPPEMLYGPNYGYRSGLNQSMVRHLESKALSLISRYSLGVFDIVLDIGSNDGTLLKFFPAGEKNRFGMDPVGAKFQKHYEDGIQLIPDFFSSDVFSRHCGSKAKLVTSISMFYDLEQPVDFAKQIFEILDDDGVWHLEQSYLPSMLATGSFDTICHEHLEYYSLASIIKVLDAAGMRPVEVDFNQVNGGSFALDVVKKNSSMKSNRALIDWMLRQEDRIGLGTPNDIVDTFADFEDKFTIAKEGLRDLLISLKNSGKTVIGYGASTKGNVLLQALEIDSTLLPAIAEVNPYKFGRRTPGTGIPIVSEQEAHELKPDYFLVLPWHFRESILQRESEYLAAGGKFLFPLPNIEIFGR